MDFIGRKLMEQPRRPSGPDAGQGRGTPANDGIDHHVDELAQADSRAGPSPLRTVPAACGDEPDESDSDSMFHLGDLESDHTGRWLSPQDSPWDPNPWLQ
jgi:hypothetical protein